MIFRLLLICWMSVANMTALPSSSHAEVAGSLAIAGNGPEAATMETLARAFEKANPRVYIDVLWDETSKPLDLVKSGQAHIAITGSEDPSLASKQIGWDGIGILVHLSNFTKDMTKQQVADLFSGKFATWADVGGPDTRILLIDRPRNQNIRDAFESQLGIAGKISNAAKIIGQDDAVVKAVVGTLPPLSAVTYISLSTGLSVVSTGVAVRLLAVDKIEPETPTVKDGRYPLRRPILMLSKKEANPLVHAFAQFALSTPGQAIIAETYVSMPSH